MPESILIHVVSQALESKTDESCVLTCISSGGRTLDADLTFIAIPTRVTTMADVQKFNKCLAKSGEFRRNKTKSRAPSPGENHQ